MIIMFNIYFELASNNNTGESIAFVVAEITFKMAVCDDFPSGQD